MRDQRTFSSPNLAFFERLVWITMCAASTAIADGPTMKVTPAGPCAWRVEIGGTPPQPSESPAGVRITPGQDFGELAIERPGHSPWRARFTRMERFGRAGTSAIAMEWQATPGENFVGLGQRFDSLHLRGRKVDMWIEDKPGQEGGASYFCTPILFSTAGWALFGTDNPEGVFDLDTSGSGLCRYERAGTRFSFYIAFGNSLPELIQIRANLQSKPAGIPDWAWGPWISRNSYEHQSEAEEAIRGHLDRNIPVAAIVQEAWKGRSETGEFNSFSPDRWPDLERFLALCAEHDIHNVLWQVPIIHPSSPQYQEGLEKGYFVKDASGNVSHREHWLSGFANIDFTNPEAVRWWQDMLRPLVKMGISGFKADDGESIKPHDVFHDGRRGWEMHNEYSFLYDKSLTDLFAQESAEGLLWCRSGSLGIEATPALWAGDQWASWSQYRSLLTAGLSAGLSGVPFWGHDIGGYIDNPSPELYIRWTQFGAFSPLMQYHGIQRRECWEFGLEAESAYKFLAHLRMNLRPYLKKSAQESTRTGLPMMRAMQLAFPDDRRFDGEDTQYMLGPDLLVTPILEEGAPGRIVKFPAGRWQHLLRPEVFEGPADRAVAIGLVDAPVFVREGASIPVEFTAAKKLGEWARGAQEELISFTPERGITVNPAVTLPLLRVDFRLEGSRISGKGQKLVTVTLEDKSGGPRSIRIGALNIHGAVLKDGPLHVEVPANGRAAQTLTLDIPARGEVSPEPMVVLAAYEGDALLSSKEISLLRPMDWLAVGPFPAAPKRAFHETFEPETNASPDSVYSTGQGLRSWKAVSSEHQEEHDGINFNALFGDTEHAAGYVMTTIESTSDRSAELSLGSDDTVEVWLNGKSVFRRECYRGAAWDQDIVSVVLPKGKSVILIKVCQDKGDWKLKSHLRNWK